jgi:hypothetical protein
VAENRWENWSGSVTTEPSALYHPETVADLVDVVERHPPPDSIRAVGAGQSFTRLGETDDVLVTRRVAVTGSRRARPA